MMNKQLGNTSLSINTQKWLEQLVQEFGQSPLTLQTVSQVLQQNDVIQIEAKMGSENEPFANVLVNQIQLQDAEVSENAFQKIVNNARLKLEQLHQLRQKREKRVFQFCLVTVGMALCLFAVGVVFFFTYPADTRIGFFTSICGIFPTFMSGTAFWIYQRENEKTKVVEDDIRQLLKVEAMLGIVSSIPDVAIRQVSYPKIFEQMKL